MAQIVFAPYSAPIDLGNSHNQTLNAVSFGFIATALLFAMFLVMAIFERVLRPHRMFRSRRRQQADEEQQVELPPGPSDSQKPELRRANSYSKTVSVLMPGELYPTYFANLIPAPLNPEGVEWPAHAESSHHDQTLQRTQSQREPVFGSARLSRVSVERGEPSGKGSYNSS